MIWSSVPCATMRPPCRPAPGPRSTIQSAPTHDRFVMFDHHNRVATRLKIGQRLDESFVVTGMEPDGWLVQNVADADQARAQSGRKPHALQFAAAEGTGGPIERQIAQADAGRGIRALRRFPQGIGWATGRWWSAKNETEDSSSKNFRAAFTVSAVTSKIVRSATRTAAGFGAQPRAFALGARHLAAKHFQPLPPRFARGGHIISLQHSENAQETLAGPF